MQATKLCKYCQTEIPKKARVCPNCRRKLAPGGCLMAFLIFVTLVIISAVFSTNNLPNSNKQSETSQEIKNNVVSDTTDSKDNNSSDKNEEKKSSATLGEKNALATAKNYLNISGFSKKQLSEQLKFEGYSDSEAKYAVKNCAADWNEQAGRKAEEYMKINSFSKKQLIEQLEFEGFTKKQAEYGAKHIGY